MRTVEKGDEIPLGLSRWRNVLNTGYQLRLPVFIWHRTHYDIVTDGKQDGWCAMHILLKTEPQEISLRWGWVMVKPTGPKTSASGIFTWNE